jgi:hypothetical protein
MAYVAKIEASTKEADRVTEALVAGLGIEFGRGAGAALVKRFLAAEEADFAWDARAEERWLGAYESVEDGDLELDRAAIVGRLRGRWLVAQMIIDGERCAHGMLGKREFGSEGLARDALADAW